MPAVFILEINVCVYVCCVCMYACAQGSILQASHMSINWNIYIFIFTRAYARGTT